MVNQNLFGYVRVHDVNILSYWYNETTSIATNKIKTSYLKRQKEKIKTNQQKEKHY